MSLVFLKQDARRVPRWAGGQTSNANVKSMSTDHWRGLFRAWSKLPTPVRVPSEATDAIKAEVAGVRGPVLLLGMTSGLLDAAADLTATDQGSKLVGDLCP